MTDYFGFARRPDDLLIFYKLSVLYNSCLLYTSDAADE